jgi:hypothetical protein
LWPSLWATSASWPLASVLLVSWPMQDNSVPGSTLNHWDNSSQPETPLI